METLEELRQAASKAETAFDAVCGEHFVNRWDYYLACEADPTRCPTVCHEAADRYTAAQHALYLARDGESGFLG